MNNGYCTNHVLLYSKSRITKNQCKVKPVLLTKSVRFFQDETDKRIRISQTDPPLHYLVADANGNAATIEFFNGTMVVHQGKDLPFPVLTNSPYVQSEGAASDAKILSGNTNFYFGDNSLQRFTKACSMVERYTQHDIHQPVVDYAFDVLKEVSQHDFTKWSIVYDLKNRKIYFKTALRPDVKSCTFSAFDFACTATPMIMDLNLSVKGDVSKDFKPFNTLINRAIIKKSVDESKSRVPISNQQKEAAIAYPGTIKCD